MREIPADRRRHQTYLGLSLYVVPGVSLTAFAGGFAFLVPFDSLRAIGAAATVAGAIWSVLGVVQAKRMSITIAAVAAQVQRQRGRLSERALADLHDLVLELSFASKAYRMSKVPAAAALALTAVAAVTEHWLLAAVLFALSIILLGVVGAKRRIYERARDRRVSEVLLREVLEHCAEANPESLTVIQAVIQQQGYLTIFQLMKFAAWVIRKR